jgi:hypothetical protein
MQLPLNDDQIDSIIFVLTPTNRISCEKCVKWRTRILAELKVGNFGNVGKNMMHLVNHLQRDEGDP